jgi:D-3-phosphoglycerate dehydrogenase
MFKVLQVSTGYTDGSVEKKLIEEAGGSYQLISGESADEIIHAGQDASALLVALTNVPAKVIQALPQLKVIVRAGIGVDNIDLDAAKASGVHVCNLPTYCQDEVADHAVALLLALERRLFAQVLDIRAHKWNPVKTYKPIHGLGGAVVGFIGCGGIARKVMARLAPFGVRFVGYDPYLSQEKADALGVTLLPLDTLLEQSDYVSLHVPLTKETRGILNKEAFLRMKPTACVINTARGPLVDNDALLNAIENHQIRGAGLDVIDGDLDAALRFADLPEVLITPHTAYYSERSDWNIRAQAGELLAAYIRTGKLKNVIV